MTTTPITTDPTDTTDNSPEAQFLRALTAVCRAHDMWITTDDPDSPQIWPSQEPGDNEALYYKLQGMQLVIAHADDE